MDMTARRKIKKKNGGKRARNGNGQMSRTQSANDPWTTVINVLDSYLLNMFFLPIPDRNARLDYRRVAAAIVRPTGH